MVMSRNKVLVVLEDGDALLMQPPNSRCGAFIILADNLRRTQRFLQSNMLSQLASCRAHNLILQPAISMSEFTAHVAAAPSAWVGAAGGSPLRDQGLAPLVNIQPDRSALSRCYMSACDDSICVWPAASAQSGITRSHCPSTIHGCLLWERTAHWKAKDPRVAGLGFRSNACAGRVNRDC